MDRIGRGSPEMSEKDKRKLAYLVANLESLASEDTVPSDVSPRAEPTPEADK